MRYRLRTLLGLMVIVGAVCAWVVPQWSRGTAMFLIESDTPGTLVYSGNRFLGETPLWIYTSEFPGFVPGRHDPPRFQGCWMMSPMGVGLWDDKLDQPSRAFWFRAPENERHKFVQYETPLGIGTRLDAEPHWGGPGFTPNWIGQEVARTRYKVHFRKVADNEGLLVEVSVPEAMPTDATHIPVTIRLRNPTSTTWCAVDDPHYVNLRYESERSLDAAERLYSQGDATQLDPGESCELTTTIKRDRLDRAWCVVFADVRYRPAGTPVEEKRRWRDFQRYSNGAVVRFED